MFVKDETNNLSENEKSFYVMLNGWKPWGQTMWRRANSEFQYTTRPLFLDGAYYWQKKYYE